MDARFIPEAYNKNPSNNNHHHHHQQQQQQQQQQTTKPPFPPPYTSTRSPLHVGVWRHGTVKPRQRSVQSHHGRVSPVLVPTHGLLAREDVLVVGCLGGQQEVVPGLGGCTGDVECLTTWGGGGRGQQARNLAKPLLSCFAAMVVAILVDIMARATIVPPPPPTLPSFLTPSQPYIVRRDTLHSCDAYGMRSTYKGK